jgi:anthraniloyl-CoA monooxygenase
MKRIVSLGGGPAGLFAAVLLKKALPKASVEVYERNRPDGTFGWGVVFSDQTMEGFRDADAEIHSRILDNFHHWDDIEVHFGGETIRTGGHGFCGISRLKLLQIMQRRAANLGVQLHFEHEFKSVGEFRDADLVIGADGVNSQVRSEFKSVFRPDIQVGNCRFIWLGTTQKFDAFTFAFEKTGHGWFQIHAYQFSPDMSTVIVETRDETWRAHGLDKASSAESIAFCEDLFAHYLNGHALLSNAAHRRGNEWLQFNRVLCENWFHENIVLIGDAAHTAHFSIGSGTKLAMEDAIAIAASVGREVDVPTAFNVYQEERNLEALKLQSAARNRQQWFENVARFTHMPPWQFSYTLLTGSQRIGHENLGLRDASFVGQVEQRLAEETNAPGGRRPPMFLPFRLRDMMLENRVVVSPMAQYMAKNGLPDAWHLVHYGARALGGAGLVYTEMTCVSDVGRITPGCTGLWNTVQQDAWRPIVEFVQENSAAKFCLQIGHSGRKGSTQIGWERMDYPLPSGNWEILSASPTPYLEGISQTPKAMTRDDMDTVVAQFAHSAKLGSEIGFDMLELHFAHGYLLASFLSPLTNQRSDEYGGSQANRLRFPLEVFAAVRAVWPDEKPMSIRLSAADWAPGGLSEKDLLETAAAFKTAGVDILDISSGQTVADQSPVYGRMYQAPYSDLVRNTIGIPTIAVGNIYEADHVNSIIAAGRADLCALARPHLASSAWTLHAAAELKYHGVEWPAPYRTAQTQLERNIERAALLARQV